MQLERQHLLHIHLLCRSSASVDDVLDQEVDDEDARYVISFHC